MTYHVGRTACWRRKLLVWFSAISVVAFFGATAFAQGSDVFVQVISHEPINLASYRNMDAAAAPVAAQIYDTLVRVEDFGVTPTRFVPGLAETFEVDDTGTVFTFQLRQGVQFHHGYGELTADDVKFTIDLHRDPATGSVERPLYEDVDRVEALDAYTVRVVLNRPYRGFLMTLAWSSGYIYSRAAVEDIGLEEMVQHPVGTGAYYFDRIVARERVILKAFDEYFEGRPAIPEVHYRIIPEEAVGLMALAGGELHAVPVQTPSSYVLMKAMGDAVDFVEAPGLQNWYHIVNSDRAPTDDIRVRQAILYAIDFDAVVDAFDGFVDPNLSYLAPVHVGWTEYWRDAPFYERDLERAAALIAEAGYSEKPTLRMAYTTGQLYQPMAELVAEQLRPVFNIESGFVDRAAWLATIDGREWNILIAALTRFQAEQMTELIIDSDGRFALHGQGNASVDQLTATARGETDPTTQAALYSDVDRLVLEEVWLFNMGTAAAITAVSPDVVGYEPHPFTGVTEIRKVSFR